ncbi:hypothetical protein M0Q28_02715 [Patescibacteria group bacterium]|jgi:hypothetical protein|nr:hypothetical protein [Patescibacteria group bacterium]
MFNWILPLFKPSFWFNAMAVPFMPWLERALPIVLAFIGLAGVVALVYAKFGKGVEKDARKLWREIGTASLLAGLAGGLLYFFHWQRVPYLSMRLFWLLWLAGFGYWAYVIWKTHFKQLPAVRAQERERAAYEKWLPKPKK